MTGPKPVQLPHIQQGNLLTDTSQAVGGFVTGLKAEQDKRRQQALEEALLGIRGMEAEGRLAQYGNADNQRYLDDLRSKGYYVRPGSHVGPQTDFGALITAGGPMQQAMLEHTLAPKAYQDTHPAPPRTVTAGGVTADLFLDPMQLRTEMEKRQAANRSGYLAQRAAYLKLAQDRFAFTKANPRETQLQVAGALPNLLASNRDMTSTENSLPEGANWAGMLKVLGETPVGRQFAPASTMMAVLTPAEQKYVIAMHRFLSDYFPEKGGKVLSENEVRQYFPIISATGFTSREAIEAVQEARNGFINQFMWKGGPATLMLLRSGQIQPGDVSQDIINQLTSLYGGDASNPQANPYLSKP